MTAFMRYPVHTNNISYGTHRQTYAHGKREDRRETERKRENASRIYINSLLLRASHISDILAQRVVSSQNFKETFSTMIRIKLSHASDKLLFVTNDACYR